MTRRTALPKSVLLLQKEETLSAAEERFSKLRAS